MAFGSIRRIAVVAALVTAAGLLTMMMAASATGASQPKRRQLAVTTLSDFRAVLTATREPGHPLLATVTAAGNGDRCWLPAIRRPLEADLQEADRQGQRVVLVLGGDLLTDDHPAQEQYCEPISPGRDVRLDQSQFADHACYRLLRHLQQTLGAIGQRAELGQPPAVSLTLRPSAIGVPGGIQGAADAPTPRAQRAMAAAGRAGPPDEASRQRDSEHQ